jgi:heterodisulfide reductase subunit D
VGKGPGNEYYLKFKTLYPSLRSLRTLRENEFKIYYKIVIHNLSMETKKIELPVMADLFAKGEKPEYLFWVGCAGAFDDRYKKVARAFAKILTHLNVSYAVLGREESCTGDPARRAGNEMLYQMQALQNIEVFKRYEVKKILTICPHCYNIFKNEYPDLGGNYEVINYTRFLEKQIKEGNLKIDDSKFSSLSITYHDPCYLGRANDIYNEPRFVLKSMTKNLVEMDRNKSFALCCGAGGAQMFKEAEKGNKEVFIERTEDALKTNAKVIATACPFCMTMMTDGLKYKNKEEEIKNFDIAELIVQAMEL